MLHQVPGTHSRVRTERIYALVMILHQEPGTYLRVRTERILEAREYRPRPLVEILPHILA